MNTVSVIGAGLAGCEATYQLAKQGISVDLYEMKPAIFTKAHHYEGFAELVCSNSLKAIRLETSSGLLKAEMMAMDSLIVRTAWSCAVPAGGALAVDRKQFSDRITKIISSLPNVKIHHQHVRSIPNGLVIVAAGPLVTQELSNCIAQLVGGKSLSFYDAAAPIVDANSIDYDRAFFGSRYGRGEARDYLNCPMDLSQYEQFYEALVTAKRVPLKQVDQDGMKIYEGCMPIEVMAKRGKETLRFGPMKPVGLEDPRTGHRPWAVVQLRKENISATMYNLVGFQTNLTWSEQKRVFSFIPGLKRAEFLRFGVMHRNTFLDSPRLLNRYFQLKKNKNIFFAGQITGVEGYVESASSGLIVGYQVARQLQGKSFLELPNSCMMGALSQYISDETIENFQPMGANMGLLPRLPHRIKDKALRYRMMAQSAKTSLLDYLHTVGIQPSCLEDAGRWETNEERGKLEHENCN